MNDIKDIRKDPDKYRKGMEDRGKDPAEIDALLEADAEARVSKTLLQNRQSQANLVTDFFALDKQTLKPEVKERKIAELEKKRELLKAEEFSTLEQYIALLDKKIEAADAEVADCDRRLIEILAPIADNF